MVLRKLRGESALSRVGWVSVCGGVVALHWVKEGKLWIIESLMAIIIIC